MLHVFRKLFQARSPEGHGDPNFYSKVGFSVITEKLVPAPLKLEYPEGWLAQSLVGHEIEPISGKSYCVEELNNPEYW